MKYLIIPILVITALLINIKISSDIKWQNKANYRWDRDLSNIVQANGRVYLTRYWGGSLDDERIAIGKKEARKFKAINYILAQDKYYK